MPIDNQYPDDSVRKLAFALCIISRAIPVVFFAKAYDHVSDESNKEEFQDIKYIALGFLRQLNQFLLEEKRREVENAIPQ